MDAGLNNNEKNFIKEYHYLKEIKFQGIIIKDYYIENDGLVNTFDVFKSINNIFYLIYSNKNKLLICYDLKNQKIVTEIKKFS